ncbi:Creatinase aminopeptidase [Coniophora puteana RWD-64-598 SS2]|uniref:Creatinase aminopeptidase n=1 Tax=Coniophora puteana (strain RWD-64-598) TaxID=741705 RepID=A0A5M3N217_CONPW|nr:Creatinase aminopeptidase [Coniophora puteana RWD-64-598 SS2]EIW85418.1 Creatinase aminopeptidase [Coniophora puteana RWD-64-598 SS2]
MGARNVIDLWNLNSLLPQVVFTLAVLALVLISTHHIITNTVLSVLHSHGISSTFTYATHAGVNPSPFAHLASHCASVPPITTTEFLARQDSLARILHEQGATAYVAEAGPDAFFFANISQASWHLSERPFLLIVTPDIVTSASADATVRARVTLLTPEFEETRARTLPVPARELHYAAWPEDGNPYTAALGVLRHAQDDDANKATILVDGNMRMFVADGLRHAAGEGAQVAPATPEVTALRERKSPAEIALLRCANEATLLAVRAARERMRIGMRESEARALVESALAAAGLREGFALTLFGENAALPHGSGTDRVLGAEDFVLVDTGGTLHGYSSDVTRTFALPDSTIPQAHIDLWHTVHTAQSIALATAHEGQATGRVDAAARAWLEYKGYARYFTHRLGHGIGIETHESPYLVGGSTDTLRAGHVFSDEPGVYIEGRVGVRLEDCFFVSERGYAVYLTEGVGGQAGDPWSP